MVRIACHLSEINKVMPVALKIKKLGYKVGINLMQISDRSNSEIKDLCNLMKKTTWIYCILQIALKFDQRSNS